MKIKFLIYTFLTFITMLILMIFILNQNKFNISDNLKKKIKKKYPNISLIHQIFKKESVILNLRNDYNVKFLPETQFSNLNLDKKKIIFNKKFNKIHQNSKWIYRSFYLDIFEEKIILADYLGGVYFIDSSKLLSDKKSEIVPSNIKTNISPSKVLDIKVYNKKIYMSYIKEINDCQYLNISVADLNFQTLKFNNFHSFKECGNFIQAGRIVSYKHNGIDGLLFSTSNQIPDDTDKNLHPPQDDESIFGKILFFDLETKEYIIFSKGHRNIQGLYTEGDLILSTEHGPKGGDEINRIKFKENYGWPLASYGEKYSSYNSKTYYKKNHISQGFQEPIFAYVPSIAISEIIRLPNEFSENFQNNFIITTLAQRHIHRVKFDKNFEKLIFDEKILIDERIRDIVYIKKNNLILMAFEEKGEIGLLSKK